MGVLPCQLPQGVTAVTLGLTGSEEFDLLDIDDHARPRQPVTLVVKRRNGEQERVQLTLRLDTPAELDYVRRGGILPYVLAGLAA